MLGGTYPTRMHSCVIFVWLMTDVRQVSTITFLKQAQFHSFLCFKSSVIALRHVYSWTIDDRSKLSFMSPCDIFLLAIQGETT